MLVRTCPRQTSGMAKSKPMTLRDLLQAHLKTPHDLMAATGKRRQTVYAWLAGRHAPTVWDQPKIAACLGVSVEELRRVLATTAEQRES